MKKLIAFVTGAAIMVAIALTFISEQDTFITGILTWAQDSVKAPATSGTTP